MKKLLFLLLLLALGCGTVSAHDFKIEKGQFVLDGKPITLVCGEMHYPRIPQEYWRDRLLRAKAMGLNCISTYVFTFTPGYPVMFLGVFFFLLLAGPGKISVDYLIAVNIERNREEDEVLDNV